MSTKDMQPEEYNGRFDLMYLTQLAENTTADETVHFIYENMVDFQNFLNSKPPQTKSFLVLKIAVKIKDTQPLEKRNSIYAKICDKSFLDNLIKKITYDLESDKISESSYREFINYINILLKNLIDNSQLQINIDLMNNVILATENIAKIVPSMADISKEIEKSRQKFLKSRDSMKPDSVSRENYRTVSLYPSMEDFEQRKYDSFKSLSQNIVKGSYRDVEHYLNVQFHLLREDFICPLREGIMSYKRLVGHLQRGSREQDSGVHIYKGVKVLSAVCGREQSGEIEYRVQLDRYYCCKIRWEYSKRLMFGSLVMFSNDNFKSFQLAIITERDVKSLRKGILSVKFVGRDVYGSKILKDQYVMAESDAFFEPVYQTLKTLQSIKCLPMEKYFLVHDVSPRRPLYMSLGSVIRLGNHMVTLNNDFTWPDHKGLNMNESQYAALKASLRQEFVVIQGPPGTGKTFLALNISKIFLNNFQSVTPVLLLAYTNHALDSFLEGTLKFTKRVVRIGGQSQNKMIDQYNFQKIKEQIFKNNRSSLVIRDSGYNWYTRTGESGKEEKIYVDWPKGFDRSSKPFPVLKKEVIQSHLEILVDTEVVRIIEEQLGLVNALFLNNRMDLYDLTGFRNNDDFLVWLLGNSYETIVSLMKKVDDREMRAGDKHENDESSRRENLFGQSEDVSFVTSEFKKESRRQICFTFEAIEGVSTVLENRQNRNNVDLIRTLRAGLNYNVRIQSSGNFNSQSDDLWSFSYQERWSLYNIWVNRIRMEIVRKLEAKKAEHTQKSTQLKDLKTKGDLELLAELKPEIIGITTTGAARLRNLLSSLAPRIVIVEEAAQVLEAHIVASISTSCQHLILIGDHKQLKPNPSTYELARWYGLDVSLFERMLNNGVCCKTLNVQHRMKPNIAVLIAPSIYPDLTNHPSVSKYPPILGVSKNLFFIDHKVWEKQDLATEGRCNPHEAEFMIALCRYLILQGYEASDIVILATYSRQQFILRELQKKEELLADVRMTVVDNYQGEECKIVLLSLVRSNREGNIGFLGAENRICVALSRAKHGLYIIGNMQLLKTRSTLWKQINATLQAQDAIGDELTLLCQVHDVETRVKSASDFKRMEHAECCRTREMCPVLLPCGHYCSRLSQTSHGDHVGYKCLQPCKRKVCKTVDDHPCPLPCYAPCTGCQVQVNRFLPQCGHIASMPCMQSPFEFACKLKINGVLCGGKYIGKQYVMNSQEVKDQVLARQLQEREVAEAQHREKLAADARQRERLAAKTRLEEQQQVLARQLLERQKQLDATRRKRLEEQARVLSRDYQPWAQQQQGQHSAMPRQPLIREVEQQEFQFNTQPHSRRRKVIIIISMTSLFIIIGLIFAFLFVYKLI